MHTLGHFFLKVQNLVKKFIREQCSLQVTNLIQKILKLKVEAVYSLF